MIILYIFLWVIGIFFALKLLLRLAFWFLDYCSEAEEAEVEEVDFRSREKQVGDPSDV